MNDFVIFTDTACDILPEILDEWDVKCIDLLFREVSSEKTYTQRDMPTDLFYQKMKEGQMFRTSAANMEDFTNAFVPWLTNNYDEVHVIDSRYFTKDMVAYVRDNKITDILFANNLIHASMPRTSEAYQQYLRQ